MNGITGDPGARARKHVAPGPSIGQDQKADLTTVEVIVQDHRPPQLIAMNDTALVCIAT